MTSLELLASGRDADVFALGESSVLRRCKRPAARSEDEAYLHAWAQRHGFPAPAVVSAQGQDMVLERIDGPTLLEAVQQGVTGVDQCAQIMADLHARLDSVPLPHDAARLVGRMAPRGSSEIVGIRHLDLHPLNVLASARGPILIDWSNADIGDRRVDVALTALILAQVAVLPGPLQEPADALVGAFRTAAPPITVDALGLAREFRALDPNMSPDEIAALGDAAALVVDPD